MNLPFSPLKKECLHLEKEMTVKTNITKVEDGVFRREEDLVIKEDPLTIYWNGREMVTLLCTLEKADYLAVGFLKAEGLLDKKEDIKSVRLEEDRGIVYVETYNENPLGAKFFGKRTITSGCGKGTIFFNVMDSLTVKPVTGSLQVTPAQVRNLMHSFQRMSYLYKETGGGHSCGLATPGEILLFSEDIGRHNALDKVIGQAIWQEMPTKDKILLSSGRLSSEIMIKTAKAEFSTLISRSAPTSLSVELAQKLGITLIGFARGRRLNIYASPERVKSKPPV